jgi:hypothetical protein
VAAVFSLTACGEKDHPREADANNDGGYVDAGPITYQLQVSRELNPYNVEDKGYLAGVPATDASLSPTQEWYGVFLWAKNQTHETQELANRFVVIDTQGNKYYQVQLNSTVNPYAWTRVTLNRSQTYPIPDSTAYWGPTQGGELLFKINTNAYANRPLTLQIWVRGQEEPSTISLDL